MLQRINLPRRSEGNPGLTYTRKALGEYWTEGEAYVVDSTQAEQIRLTVQVVSALFKQAMDYVIDNPNILDRFTLMGDERLDKQLRTLIKESWKKTPSYVVDRWDMAWDGTHPPKLLERNFGFLGLLMATGSVQEEYVEWLRQAAKKTNIHSFN